MLMKRRRKRKREKTNKDRRATCAGSATGRAAAAPSRPGARAVGCAESDAGHCTVARLRPAGRSCRFVCYEASAPRGGNEIWGERKDELIRC